MAYGYRLDGKKIVIDPEAALIVSRIFQWYLSGVNKTEIAKRLNEEGVPSGQQKQWYAAAVRYILTNEKYTGDSLWQKTYTSHTLPATRYKNTGEYEQFYAMGTHPPIISKKPLSRHSNWRRNGNPLTGRSSGVNHIHYPRKYHAVTAAALIAEKNKYPRRIGAVET